VVIMAVYMPTGLVGLTQPYWRRLAALFSSAKKNSSTG